MLKAKRSLQKSKSIKRSKLSNPVVSQNVVPNKRQKALSGTNSQIADSSEDVGDLTENNKKSASKIVHKKEDNSKPIAMAKQNKGSELSEVDLKKIEKKKAKKMAQKLKKAQRKILQATEQNEGVSVSGSQETQSAEPKKAINGSASGQKSKQKQTPPPAKDAETTATVKVLDKKEKKSKKRQALKEQKEAEKKIRTPAEEQSTVFVGNLPVNTKRVQLARLFQKYGTVHSIRFRSAGGKVLHKHKMRKAAGSLNAYVNLGNKTSAENALALNGTEFKGNHLRITRSVQNYAAHIEHDEAKRTVFVGNLKYSATEESLREIFTSCGEIEYVRCIRDGDRGCKGVAYVCFKNADAVGLALELKDTILDERPINVERFNSTKLGAKAMRDAQTEIGHKAKQHTDQKKHPKKDTKSNIKNKSGDVEVPKKAKKGEFRGVKIDPMKKRKKVQKIKKSKALELARKIAPKAKTEK